MRTVLARKTILDVLERCQPHALPEDSLLLSLNVYLRPACAQAEFDEHIVWLKSHGMIAEMPGAFGDDKVRWLITEAGQAELRR